MYSYIHKRTPVIAQTSIKILMSTYYIIQTHSFDAITSELNIETQAEKKKVELKTRRKCCRKKKVRFTNVRSYSRHQVVCNFHRLHFVEL